MAAYSRADLNEMIDAYGGRTQLLNAMGFHRGKAGTDERRDYIAVRRSLERALAPATAKETHKEVTSRGKLGLALQAKIDPTWVKVNAAINRYKARHGGQSPRNVEIEAEYRVSNDKRKRAVMFPLDDPDLIDELSRNMEAFVSEQFGQDTELTLDGLTFG